MAIRIYEAIKNFVFNDASFEVGQEIFLNERDGDKLIQNRSVKEGRAIDPKSEQDTAALAAAENSYDEKYDENMAKEASRDDEKQAELTQKDEENSEKEKKEKEQS